MEKIIKNTVLAMFVSVILASAIVLFGACNQSSTLSPWGKTFTYSGTTDISKLNYTLENKTLTISQVFDKYFDKIDWETTLGKTKDEVGTAQNAYTLFTQKIYTISASDFAGISFQFSSEADKQVTIKNQTFDLTVTQDDNYIEYKFAIGEDPNYEEIKFYAYDKNNLTYSANLFGEVAETLLPASENFCGINFLEEITTEGAEKTASLSVFIYALFTAN